LSEFRRPFSSRSLKEQLPVLFLFPFWQGKNDPVEHWLQQTDPVFVLVRNNLKPDDDTYNEDNFPAPVMKSHTLPKTILKSYPKSGFL
jgi:hypothetical protein